MRYTLFILACIYPAAQGMALTNESELPNRAGIVLKEHCYRCHGQNGAAEGGLSYVLDFSRLLDAKLVIPGDATKSRLYRRMHPDLIGDMPDDDLTQVTAEDLSIIEAWINSGAKTAADRPLEPRTFVSLKDELSAASQYLRNAPRDERRVTRFFSIRHLHNLPLNQVRDEDLRIYRAALSKLVNSLSRATEIIAPVAVDEHSTLLAINLRQVHWDQGEKWDEILKLYPYGLHHAEYPDQPDIQVLAEEVYSVSGTKIPVIRADWFVTAAARPPLYHLLLDLPDDARLLERQLGVDVIDDFLKGNIRRGGFNGSGVSGNNRMVQRHSIATGAYWKSYDFFRSAGRGNLFVFPLGPEFDRHPFSRNAFKHDGGEIIFNLPNGLQAYLLVDSQDRRIDVGPIEVVSDGKKVSGTPAIVNGLSCMACHQHGIIPFTDQIRTGHILGGEARAAVNRLYPEKSVMDELIARDRQRFLEALDKATGPFLKVGTDAARSIDDFPEPITAIARWYLQQELTAEQAAFELGFSDAQTLIAIVQANPRLQLLGLYPLASGATIKRDTWEDISFVISPFQEAARELKLGTPVSHR